MTMTLTDIIATYLPDATVIECTGPRYHGDRLALYSARIVVFNNIQLWVHAYTWDDSGAHLYISWGEISRPNHSGDSRIIMGFTCIYDWDSLRDELNTEELRRAIVMSLVN